MPEALKNFLSSRKDLMAFVVIGIAAAMVFTGKLTFEEWKDFVVWVGGSWMVVRGLEDTVVKREAIRAGASKGPPGGASADT